MGGLLMRKTKTKASCDMYMVPVHTSEGRGACTNATCTPHPHYAFMTLYYKRQIKKPGAHIHPTAVASAILSLLEPPALQWAGRCLCAYHAGWWWSTTASIECG